ncbi:MAG: DeoR/GlpR transcriptional regulator [Lachnospiraceae bacterium]|jgi:DeoR family fructose operon transcriptional repressor|nr:DeoR/GlpR transcriptional regulator [Lachnospiraceae bacterium]RKJ48903.1 DeoR/GlpR transcriptional regulator [bacterium 1XD42-54]
MFVTERQNEIRKQLLEHKRITVSSLSKLLHVTEVTIRKDLEQLEQEGFLVRQFGGAVLKESPAALPKQTALQLSCPVPRSQEKLKISALCTQYIQNEDIIFLGGDDFGCFIADELKKSRQLSHVIVITNCLYITVCLSSVPFVTLFSLGGQLYNVNGIHAYYGTASDHFLDTLYINKAFVGVDAVSFEQGLMISINEITNLYTHLKKQSDEVIFLFESSRFNKRSLYHLADLCEAQTIITTSNIPNGFKKHCFDSGIKLFTAFENDLDQPIIQEE